MSESGVALPRCGRGAVAGQSRPVCGQRRKCACQSRRRIAGFRFCPCTCRGRGGLGECSGARADRNRQSGATSHFYTSLYHSLLAPTLFSDVDGRYRGMDLQVHTLPTGYHNYSTYSLWDTYRALHPLLTLVQSDRVPDLLQCLVRGAAECPDGVGIWPLQGVETGCMIGYHSAVVLAEGYTKGFTGIDYAAAWPHYRKRAMQDHAHGLRYYRRLGYIPSDKVDESVSRTLEYAYDDWACAHLATAAGAHSEARVLRARSRHYRHVFNRDSGFMQPRLENGAWATPFDPRALGHLKQWHDFTECNA